MEEENDGLRDSTDNRKRVGEKRHGESLRDLGTLTIFPGYVWGTSTKLLAAMRNWEVM